MENQRNTNTDGIWRKLLEIQRSVKPLSADEDSDKTDDKGKAAYKYTPGWRITEAVKSQMDSLGLMLVPEFRFHSVDLIEYPVYRMIGDQPMSFTKKEMHIAVEADFTWVDTDTGEKAGPFHIVASGANGTDKSTASALALAERYFMLKFFHITTRDADDEPDAHDSDNVPGIPRSRQMTATPTQACAAARGGSSPAGVPQRMRTPGPPGYASPRAQRQDTRPIDDTNPAVQAAINALVMFERGTQTHGKILNETIANLARAGVNIREPNFAENLSETAQARRENRAPVYR